MDLSLFWSRISAYFDFCLRDVLGLSRWRIFLLLAPALVFDTTRYYFTNTLYLFLHTFGLIRNRYKRLRHVDDAAKMPLPLVSIIVPVYNEGKHLTQTLDALCENNYPRKEIIIIDDHSSDETSLICRKYARAGKIKYLRKATRSSKPGALNYGLAFAKGEIVLHMDGDTILLRNAISEGVKPFRDPKVGCVSGNLRLANDTASLATRLQSAEFAMIINVQRRWLSHTNSLQIASGAFSLYRKAILDELGGVDPEYGEDLDLTLKVRKRGLKVVFQPSAIALTDMPETFTGIFKQRMRWDRCYIRINLRKHGNLWNFRVFPASDALTYALDFLFNVLLLAVFPVYIILVAVFVPHLLPFLFAVTYLFYTLMLAWQCLIGILLSDRKWHDSHFILYSPLLFFYFFYLRFCRATAYLLETFRSKKMQSEFFPHPVRACIPKY